MAIAGEFGLELTPEGRAALSMLDELEDIVVEVGYQADQMAIDGETSLAEIAYWNHYGTLHKDGSVMIPARPFMDALQKHPDELAEFSQQAASNLNTAETVASAIGAQASSMILPFRKQWQSTAAMTPSLSSAPCRKLPAVI